MDYGTSFQGQILIENLTDKPIECWELTFSSANFTLQNSWERTLIDLGNGRYTIKPIAGNIVRIAPNSTLTLGFQANKDSELDFANLNVTFEGLTGVEFTFATIEKEMDLTDTDEDGLPDEYELLIDTDPLNPDTDGDGLPDGYEYFTLGTSPLNSDTDENGVSDEDEDFDEDGLTNLEEYLLGTNPWDADSDGDELSDGDEVHVYGTDPLNPDTDEDGVRDGDELKLELNPLNPKTFGYSDKEYIKLQIISSDCDILSKINGENNKYQLSVEMEAAGWVEGNIIATKSSYLNVIQNDSMLGIATELVYEGFNIRKATLKFKIADEFLQNEVGTLSSNPELSGIKRLNVFKYFEDINMLLPINTKFDIPNKTIYAEVDELGTYCIMDMEKWLLSLGSDVNAEKNDTEDYGNIQPISVNATAFEYNYINTNALSSVNEETAGLIAKSTESSTMIPSDINSSSLVISTSLNLMSTSLTATSYLPIDVVFLLQTFGEEQAVFNAQRQMIIDLSTQIFNQYTNARIYVIEYTNNTMRFSSGGYPAYFTSASDVKTALNAITYRYNSYISTGNWADRGLAFWLLVNEVVFRQGANNFVFSLYNGSNAYSLGGYDQVSACEILDVNYSEIISQGYSYVYADYGRKATNTIAETFGLFLTYNSSTETKVYNHICSYATGQDYDYNIFCGMSWDRVNDRLDGPLSPTNGYDTDGDTLTDWQEVDTRSRFITWDANGNMILPSIWDILNSKGEFYYLEYVMDRFISNIEGDIWIITELSQTKVLPVLTNPLKEDSDGDGVLDAEDPLPLIYGISKRLSILDRDSLIDEFTALVNQEWKHKYKDFFIFGGRSEKECVDILYEYDELITNISNTYMLPKSIIQATLFRELVCYWIQDTIVDDLVMFSLMDDTSTGLAQIYAWVAIDATNWAIEEGKLEANYLHQERNSSNLNDVETIWNRLRFNEEYNIEMCAIVLMYGVSTTKFDIQGLHNKYWRYNEDEIKAVFKRYNGSEYAAAIHSERVYELYLVFEIYK